MIALLIILGFLATFSAGAVFGGILVMAYYEKRIQQGEYFTKQEKEELEDLPKVIQTNDWVVTKITKQQKAEDNVHRIGLHGAVGFLTKQGLVCAECGKLIKTPTVYSPWAKAKKQREEVKKKLMVTHGSTTHPIGAPCGFCDKVKKEFEMNK